MLRICADLFLQGQESGVQKQIADEGQLFDRLLFSSRVLTLPTATFVFY
ncbi:Uncharacterised protein [Serratia quinivorans]|nr:Uncharacterised protein [Serratia quinivorans]CAI0763069.1 Uncharacterised protein [Serratia quinivorans]CAI0785372.1 Uncharacterised protein [Serratia quinivorans]CAI1693783.1 Uncharacterised protein [Serratia quinivorans]CAI2057891.1 Uncharacterised protein [Serratia quinivorans]